MAISPQGSEKTCSAWSRLSLASPNVPLPASSASIPDHCRSIFTAVHCFQRAINQPLDVHENGIVGLWNLLNRRDAVNRHVVLREPFKVYWRELGGIV